MVDATRFLGAWLRAGEGIGWLAAGTIPNSLYRMPFVYLFLTCVFCYSCSFFFVVFFYVFVFFFCSHWSLVDVPLIFFCPADHVPDWQPRVLLGMVEARSVNVKKTTTTVTIVQLQPLYADRIIHYFCCYYYYKRHISLISRTRGHRVQGACHPYPNASRG